MKKEHALAYADSDIGISTLSGSSEAIMAHPAGEADFRATPHLDIDAFTDTTARGKRVGQLAMNGTKLG